MALDLAEAHLRGLLSTLGLAVEYVRGEGDTLWWRSPDGEVPVVDFVGGYGSLMFGHNHPELVAHAQSLLGRQLPVHAQFSHHPYADELATALNQVLWREFGTSEPYAAIFANTGAEAVEAALKHAEMDRGLRVAALAAQIDAHVEQARASGHPGVDGLVARVREHNAGLFDRTPVFLALENAFHGKLAGSVQLTHNPGYRVPFRGLAAQARFVPADAVGKVLDDERVVVLDLEVSARGVRVVEQDLPVIAAFFVEALQGEGGIHVLDAGVAARIHAAADAGGFPVVVDEIQSGMGRTGALFAASHIGLLGDYVLLAKALGGGLAKSSVLLVRRSRYQPDFELVHSSTFAKDAFSCHIGLKVVELLEADGGAAYRQAAERGAALAEALRAVADEFPTVVTDVRGRGLMLGMEFADLAATPGPIGEFAGNGLFGYLLAGYLLREHRVRVFPTASAPRTLRFEPSIHIRDEAIEQLTAGLREVCAALRDRDGLALLPA